MKISLYKRTTDNDLSVGQKVAYKDIEGQYTRTGVIKHISDDYGALLYTLDSSLGSYLADELKLIQDDFSAELQKPASKQPYSYVIIKHNYPELERESVLLENNYEASKKYALINKAAHEDGSESINFIHYSNNLELLQSMTKRFISWYNYPLGLCKHTNGEIKELSTGKQETAPKPDDDVFTRLGNILKP